MTELEHHLAVGGQAVELVGDRGPQQLLGLRLLRAVDVDLGLDDRHQADAEDLAADLELLVDDRVDAGLGRHSLMTERILVPNMPFSTPAASSASRSGIGFISWAPSASSARPLSTLRNGTTPLTSQR